MSKLINLRKEKSEDTHAMREALKRCLKRGLDRCVIGHEAIVELCLTLAQDPGSPQGLRCAGLDRWLDNYLNFSLYSQEFDMESSNLPSPNHGDSFQLTPPPKLVGVSAEEKHRTHANS